LDILIDSNIWAYYLDSTTTEHKKVVNPVRRALRGEVWINTVVQIEVAHYLVKRLGPVLGAEKAEKFLSYPFRVDELTVERVREAVEILKEYSHLGIGGRDATLLATMKAAGIRTLMTHDEALKRVEWVKAIDPCGERL
jgi:predicted nucleic acid-binding protein